MAGPQILMFQKDDWMTDGTERGSTQKGTNDRPVKLACRNVWKLFGTNAASFIRERDGKASMADVTSAGLVGAVRAVDLEIRQGEIFIIMGLSGSGKSTLVRCMSRLVEPSHGKVEFEGKDLLKISDAALIELRRHRMGMVFQNFALLPHLNVLDNIAFPLSIQGQDRATREARAREVIELVGLHGREHFYPRELSGGQQQRVGIARAVAMEPKILLLDEITSALDPELVGEVLAVVRSLAEDGMTMLMVTHEMAFARDASSRIVFMADGCVSAVGPPKEILAAETSNERLRTFLARFRASHF